MGKPTSEWEANREAARTKAEQNWVASVPEIPNATREGLAESGVTAGPQFMQRLQAGLARAHYRYGSTPKWFRKTVAGMQR